MRLISPCLRLTGVATGSLAMTSSVGLGQRGRFSYAPSVAEKQSPFCQPAPTRRRSIYLAAAVGFLLLGGQLTLATAATTQERYYAHAAVHDGDGVIAPWYSGQNGLVDYRVRVAAEFLKRYPWVSRDQSVMAGPHWVFNARVDLNQDGKISVLPATDQMNGNLGQRFKYITEALPRYYRYTGDPVVLGHLKIAADFLLDHYLTPENHSWPRFPISVPQTGKPYGAAAPGGWIQLDLSAGIGLGLLRSYQMTGEPRYLAAARHIGDVFASKCSFQPGTRPWNRYAEGGESPWGLSGDGNRLTGGVANILIFLDELIRLGYPGPDRAIVRARDAGRVYLRDSLLPAWTANDTWGRHYWDWEHPVQGILPTGWVAQYLMDHQDVFPDWKYDVRNVLSLYLNRACVSTNSNGDVYSGAWAYPEGCACCGRSLDICPTFLGRFWARYSVEAGSDWAREIVRRTTILSFYHFCDSGLVEDNIDGGQITAREWSELIGFGPILCGLEILGWLPEVFGPARENHLVRSSSTVNAIVYGPGRIEYSTFDAPAPSVDVLRLSFCPRKVVAGTRRLRHRHELNDNGFTTRKLNGGDWIVTVRHDGARAVRILGADPQAVTDDGGLTYEGAWETIAAPGDFGGKSHVTESAGAAATCRFQGNQVRLIGRADPSGGLADVYLDGARQLVGIDCWTPGAPKQQQVLYYRNGLSNGSHDLKVVARGEKNAYARSARIFVDAVQSSAAAAEPDFGAGGGPRHPQRMIFGYSARQPYVDASGNEWLPGTEFVVRSGHNLDSVTQAWWTQGVTEPIANTRDPELYRYGVHAPEFWINVTVAPGNYRVRLRFAERREETDPRRRPMTISLNGQPAVPTLDIAARAGGRFRAFDLDFADVRPSHGVIEIRLSAPGGEAMLQALEIIPSRIGGPPQGK